MLRFTSMVDEREMKEELQDVYYIPDI